MIIGIDASPLKTGHKFRGTGSYTENLVSALEKYVPENEYKLFNQREKLPPKIDLIHYPYFEPFFLTLPVKKLVPTVVTVHDLTPLVFPEYFPAGFKGSIKWKIQQLSLKGVKAVITDSECSKKDVVKIVGIPENKVFVIYLAAGEEFKQIKEKKNELEKIRVKYHLPEKFALYVGDATWNKNLPRIIKAIQKINVPIVLVGKQTAEKNFDRSNPWNKDLLEIEKITDNDERTLKLGFVPEADLVGIYNLATVCVQPSLYEGFGLPILEAMACGCPVVTSNAGSLGEVAGKAAFYVNNDDVNDIADGVGEIYFNKQIQEKFRKAGILRASQFSWEKTACETASIYEQVLSGK